MMMYPDITTKEWKKRYPKLKTPTIKCCGLKFKANIPYILTRTIVGFCAEVSQCPICQHSTNFSLLVISEDIAYVEDLIKATQQKIFEVELRRVYNAMRMMDADSRVRIGGLT